MPAERGTTSVSMDDLCHMLPFAFNRLLYITVIERSTMPSSTNRHLIADILSFTSVEIAFDRLSNIRLLCIVTIPQAIASLRLY
jgi:hypothetical protein